MAVSFFVYAYGIGLKRRQNWNMCVCWYYDLIIYRSQEKKTSKTVTGSDRILVFYDLLVFLLN